MGSTTTPSTLLFKKQLRGCAFVRPKTRTCFLKSSQLALSAEHNMNYVLWSGEKDSGIPQHS